MLDFEVLVTENIESFLVSYFLDFCHASFKYFLLNLNTWTWEEIFLDLLGFFLRLGLGISEILTKDSYDYDFTTWQSVSGLKNIFDTFSMLANVNFWTQSPLGLFKPLFNAGSIFGQCKLLPYVICVCLLLRKFFSLINSEIYIN